jgi:hypothetical protein
MQPHFIHDCTACQFLGAVPGPRGPVDLYVHSSELGNTYIARHGSDGPAYSSAGDGVLDGAGEKYFPLLAIARKIAQLIEEV